LDERLHDFAHLIAKGDNPNAYFMIGYTFEFGPEAVRETALSFFGFKVPKDAVRAFVNAH